MRWALRLCHEGRGFTMAAGGDFGPQSFSGPFLHHPGRRLLPAPLRAFVDFNKSRAS